MENNTITFNLTKKELKALKGIFRYINICEHTDFLTTDDGKPICEGGCQNCPFKTLNGKVHSLA